EFLGDAILGFVVCEMLFRQFPEYLEGELTKVKSVVVSRQTCAKISEGLGLQEFLILGKGMTTHPTVPPSVLADVFESLGAAVYLDGGEPVAHEFVSRFLSPGIDLVVAGDLRGLFFARRVVLRFGGRFFVGWLFPSPLGQRLQRSFVFFQKGRELAWRRTPRAGLDRRLVLIGGFLFHFVGLFSTNDFSLQHHL